MACGLPSQRASNMQLSWFLNLNLLLILAICWTNKWSDDDLRRLNVAVRLLSRILAMHLQNNIVAGHRACILSPLVASFLIFHLKKLSRGGLGIGHYCACLHTLPWRHNGHDGVSNHQPHDYSTVYSGRDQGKHQSSASLTFVGGIHLWPVNSLHKWPVTRNMFPFNDVIMMPRNLVILGLQQTQHGLYH